MKPVFAFFLAILLLSAAQAQQLVRERIYKIGSTRRLINTSHLTRQGNVILSGNYNANPDFRHSYLLLKPNTDTLWTRSGVLLKNGDNTLLQTPNSGFTFLGTVQQAGTTGSQIDALLQRLDVNGFPKWSKVYNYTVNDKIDLALVALDSGYFLAGMGGVNGNLSQFFLSRTDSLGNLKWQKDYTWSAADNVVDIKYNRHGEIIMAGRTLSLVSPFYGSLKLLLVNQNGDSIRSRRISILGPTRWQQMQYTYNSVTPLSDGGYLVTAEIDTALQTGLNPKMGMVVKTNANLQPVWYYIKRQNPQKQHIFTKAKELADGSVLVLAFEESYSSNKFFLYRFSSTGTLLNTYTFTSTLATMVRAVTLDALLDSTFIIGGEATVTPPPNYTSGFYVAKVKIAGLPQVLGLKPEMPQSVAKATLGLAYPNPAAAEVTIPFVLPQHFSKASILIRELSTGREIRHYELKSNTSSLRVDLSQLSNGLYLYSLVVDEQPVATKKMAVMK